MNYKRVGSGYTIQEWYALGGVNRWYYGMNSGLEFIIVRRDTSGAYVDVPFKIDNSSGRVTVANDIYVGDNCSAESFTDRTPFYDGDALKEIKKIRGKNGKLDHKTLPPFARKTIVMPAEKDEKGKVVRGERSEDGRDLGAMISMLTVAVQQLTDRIEKLEETNGK